MSDDLVRRLREDQPVTQDMRSTMQCDLQDAAADRIEELEAKLKESEALLEKAVEALEAIATDDTWGLEHETYMKCRKALRELKGDSDD